MINLYKNAVLYYFFVVYKLLILVEITNFSKKTRWGWGYFLLLISLYQNNLIFYFDVYNFILHFFF